jgi:hypothetical protein
VIFAGGLPFSGSRAAEWRIDRARARALVNPVYMPLVQLRRHAPEVQSITTCCVCGEQRPNLVTDHLLVGSPGVPSEQGAVCDTCGRVLEQFVAKLGSNLTVHVEHAKREAGEQDGRARPAVAPGATANRPERPVVDRADTAQDPEKRRLPAV